MATLMGEKSSQKDLVKAKTATLTAGNCATVNTWRIDWCVKTAKHSAASHKILQKLLRTHTPIMEAVYATLILKNSDPRFMLIHTRFIGLADLSLDAVIRAYMEYSIVLHNKGDTPPPLIGAGNNSFGQNRRPKKDKLSNDSMCEHPRHKGN